MAWQPQEDGLKQLAGYLRDSLGGFDRPKQKQAEIVSGDCQKRFSAVLGQRIDS